MADDLDDLIDQVEELDGENSVPLGELFNPGFMRKYTDFETIEQFFEESQWTVESEEDLEAIPDGPFNEYVDEHTIFENHEEMTEKAGEEWVSDQLGF